MILCLVLTMDQRLVYLLFMIWCCSGQGIVNVALNKAALQSNPRNKTIAARAVNGNVKGILQPDNCIKTSQGPLLLSGRKIWWQVNLGRKYPVYRIEIFNHLYHQNRLIPSTITVDDQHCYTYGSQFKTRNVSFTCDSTVYGQVVRISKSNTSERDPYLSLCEFQVLVCESGYYGDNCSLPCANSRCAYCDQPTGSVCYDCAGGYYGKNCDQGCWYSCQSCELHTGACTSCKPGYWGTSSDNVTACRNKCPSRCPDKLCDSNTGLCLSCAAGFWGPGCDRACGSNCQNSSCDRVSGSCSSCKPGYWGSQGDVLICHNRCKNPYCRHGRCDVNTGQCPPCESGIGRWGPNCTYVCPRHCSDSLCDVTTGQCLSCEAGFWGSSCNKTCALRCNGMQCNKTTGQCLSCYTGFWGSHCDETCAPQCSWCNKTTGHCLSCQTGFWGSGCEKSCAPGCEDHQCDQKTGFCPSCSAGLWGVECRDACRSKDCKNNLCDKTAGRCLDCNRPDLQLPFCACSDGSYGLNCSSTCGQCAGGAICDKVTGHCASCPPGLQPPFCQQECPDGKYGHDCSHSCGHCLNGVPCRHDNGVCEFDCADGYTGVLCQKSQESPRAASEELTGPVVGAILGAGLIITIGIVVAVCWRKRSRNNINGRSNRQSLSQPAYQNTNVKMQEQARVVTIRPSPVKSTDEDVYEEMGNPENNYDKLQVYSNATADETPYTQLTSLCPTASTSDDAYVNVMVQATEDNSVKTHDHHV